MKEERKDRGLGGKKKDSILKWKTGKVKWTIPNSYYTKKYYIKKKKKKYIYIYIKKIKIKKEKSHIWINQNIGLKKKRKKRKKKLKSLSIENFQFF